MRAKIMKAVAARQAKRDTEERRVSVRAAYDERERVRKHKTRVNERRSDLKRRQGQILSESEVRRPGCFDLLRTGLGFDPLPHGPRETSARTSRDDGTNPS